MWIVSLGYTLFWAKYLILKHLSVGLTLTSHVRLQNDKTKTIIIIISISNGHDTY